LSYAGKKRARHDRTRQIFRCNLERENEREKKFDRTVGVTTFCENGDET